MTGDVTVALGVTLTVQAGVTVEGNSSTRTLTVNGSLSAVGTSGSPIVFTSTSDSGSGQWNGITFGTGSGTSTLQYALVRYGGDGGTSSANGMVTVNGGTVTVADSTLSESAVSGLAINGGTAGTAATVTVQRSKFAHNGFIGASLHGDGLSGSNANVTIQDSAFWQNAIDGIDYTVGTTYTPAEATITGSSIWANKRYGIWQNESSGTTKALAGHVAGQSPNELYDNGGFTWTAIDNWSQLDLTGTASTTDWTGNYWGPATFVPCTLGSQTGHVAYAVPAADPSIPIQIARGPVNFNAVSDPSGFYCGNDLVTANTPLPTQPDLYFDPPPPGFGGLIPAAVWNCKECERENPLIAPSLNATSPNPAQNVGDPVNTATGELFENATDLQLAGPGTPFAWQRSYNSADVGTSGLGVGWTDPFEARLTLTTGSGPVTYRAGSGQQTVFTNASGTSSGNATYRAKGFDGVLKRNSSNAFVMTTRDQRVFSFDSAGKLTSIKPRFLPATTLAYTSGKLSSITDSAGRTVAISYSATYPALIEKVTLPDGRYVQYGYDTASHLTSVQDARGKTWTLAYDTNGRLTSILDPTSVYEVQSVVYDSQGRVTSEQDGAAATTSFAYSNDGTYDLTTVTYPGHTGSWVYKQIGNQVFFVTDPLSDTTAYSYDAMARTATVTDPNGNTTRYEYDVQGDVTKTVAPASLNTVSSTYNATGDLLTRTDGRGNATSYVYATASDAAADYQVGQLKTLTDRENGVATYKYWTTTSSPTPPTDNVGLLKSRSDQRSKTTSYGYDSSGNLTSITSPLGFKTTLGYDASGRLTSRRDPRGNQVTPAAGYLTQWAYDNVDHVSTLTDARGNVTSYAYTDNELPYTVTVTDRGSTPRVVTYAYDTTNSLYTTTDPRSGVETRLYWPDGQLKQVTSPAGRISSYTYDDADRLATMVEPDGNAAGATASDYTWTYGYDAAGNQTSAQHPDGGTSQIGYDPLNRPNLWTDPLSHTHAVTYDANSNITSTTDGLSHSANYTYDKIDRQLTAQNELGKTTTYTYFSTGQLATVTTPLGNETTYSLDDDGRTTGMVEPRGNVSGCGCASNYTWAYGYDAANNRTSVTDPLGHATSYSYDELNDVTQISDANSNATGFSYDVLNRLWKVTPPAAGNTGTLDTVLAYDPDGSLATRTDPNNNTTSWTYDLDGLQTQKATPVGTWNDTYDANGNLKTLETPAGSSTGTVSYGYDRMSRLTGVTYSDSTPAVSRSYDNAGRLTGMTDGTGTVTYSYDNANRLTDSTRSLSGSGLNGTFHYDYDAANQITGRTYPDTTATTAGYDDDGLLTSVTAGGNTTSFSYDPAGNLTVTTDPSGNGYTETHTYDRAGRLTTVDNAKSGTSLSKFSWTLDPVGNPTIVDTLRAGTDTYDGYQYDTRNRLTTACYSITSTATDCTGASNTIAYSYDKVDNLTQQIRAGSVSNPGTTAYTYNTADQLTSSLKSGTTTNYSYDTNGNQTGNGTNTFTYNLANQLVASTTASVTTNYSYDGDGNRLTSQTTGGADLNYTWDNQAPTGIPELTLEQTSTGTLVRRYLNGPNGATSMTNSAGTYYYAHDPLGSTSDLTNSTGAAQWAYNYEPYGASRTATNVSGSAPENRLQFDSQYLDSELSQYNMRAREYDPVTGQFLELDPLVDRTLQPYRYASANPLTQDDPTGLGIPRDWGTPTTPLGGSNGAHPGPPVWGGGQLNGYPTRQAAVDDNAPRIDCGYTFRHGDAFLAGFDSLYRDIRDARRRLLAWEDRNPQFMTGLQLAIVVASGGGDVGPGMGPGMYAPARELPRDPSGRPLPDIDVPHTQLGTRQSRSQPGTSYRQAREFDANGKPVRDVDWTDHGRGDHQNPHQHLYDPLTGKRLPWIPFP
jgi:RHS repeat-associated protein